MCRENPGYGLAIREFKRDGRAGVQCLDVADHFAIISADNGEPARQNAVRVKVGKCGSHVVEAVLPLLMQVEHHHFQALGKQ